MCLFILACVSYTIVLRPFHVFQYLKHFESPCCGKVPHTYICLALHPTIFWQRQTRNWLHFWAEIKDSVSSEWTSSWPLRQTLLPLQMLASGQSLSSISGPGHWLSSSSLETGKPESRSRQARKRLWIEIILLPLITPAWEVLCCREEEGTQGEHGVHADHSLRMTERG